jgi:signal transduction histidine kinase
MRRFMLGTRLARLGARFGGLSGKLLVLTGSFVMLAEVLVFVPSVARDRLFYLDAHIDAAHLAAFALEATPDNNVSQSLADELLAHVGAHGIAVHRRDNATLMIDAEMPPTPDATYDLRDAGFYGLIRDAMVTLFRTDNRLLRILDATPKDPGAIVEVLLDEKPLRLEMWGFGGRVLGLSILISLSTATLVYLSLQWLLVAPLRRLTASMVSFGENPEDASRVIVPGNRSDEVGLAERELAALEETVRQALRQKERLAALGIAVAKINHDLRNMLSTARLLSDSLAASAAPEVRRIAPELVAAIDRAVALCTRSLTFTREGAPPLRRSRFAVAGLVEELADQQDRLVLDNQVRPSIIGYADRDQLYRVLQNLVRNAAEAGAQNVVIRAAERDDGLEIEVADDGPGLPPKARDNLFRAFVGSARPGGTGLGLAISRELMRGHGGDIALVDSTGSGTVFSLTLPRDGER